MEWVIPDNSDKMGSVRAPQDDCCSNEAISKQYYLILVAQRNSVKRERRTKRGRGDRARSSSSPCSKISSNYSTFFFTSNPHHTTHRWYFRSFLNSKVSKLASGTRPLLLRCSSNQYSSEHCLAAKNFFSELSSPLSLYSLSFSKRTSSLRFISFTSSTRIQSKY